MADRVGRYTPLTGVWPVIVQSVNGGGATVRLAREAVAGYQFDAIITNQGPGGSADFTDERYWVKPATPIPHTDPAGGTPDPSDNITFAKLADPNAGVSPGDAQELWPLPVTNLAELGAAQDETTNTPPAGTHLLPRGRTVRVRVSPDSDNNAHFTMSEAPRFFYLVKITATSWQGTALGRGKYAGKVMNPTNPAADITLAPALAASDLGTAGADCLILSLLEVDSTEPTAHAIDPAGQQVYFHARLKQYQSDGTPVFEIDNVSDGC